MAKSVSEPQAISDKAQGVFEDTKIFLRLMEGEFVMADKANANKKMSPVEAEVHKISAVLRFVNEASVNIHTFLSPEKIDELVNGLKTAVGDQTKDFDDKDKDYIQKTLAIAEAKLKGFDVNALNNELVRSKTNEESNEIKKAIRDSIISLSKENIATSEYNDRLKTAIMKKLAVPEEQRAAYEAFIDKAVVNKKLLTKVKDNEISILEKVAELTFQSFIDISNAAGAEKNTTLESWKKSANIWDGSNVGSLDKERSIESTRIVEDCIKQIESANPKLKNLESYKRDEMLSTLSQEVYRNKELSTEFLKNPESDKEVYNKLQQIVEKSLDSQFKEQDIKLKKQELIKHFIKKQPTRPNLDEALKAVITEKLEAVIDISYDKIKNYSQEQLDKFYKNATKAALNSVNKKTTYSLLTNGKFLSANTIISVNKAQLQTNVDRLLVSISPSVSKPKVAKPTIRGRSEIQR
ncbi:MAG: hypothetical protein J0M23_07535 [Rickettsiales bacterium]|nr:hypothetical protein [Rickettsiales bacterium]